MHNDKDTDRSISLRSQSSALAIFCKANSNEISITQCQEARNMADRKHAYSRVAVFYYAWESQSQEGQKESCTQPCSS